MDMRRSLNEISHLTSMPKNYTELNDTLPMHAMTSGMHNLKHAGELVAYIMKKKCHVLPSKSEHAPP